MLKFLLLELKIYPRENKKKENWEIAEVIFDVIRHIAVQNEAFRGHDKSKTSLNQGKFLEKIKFLAKYYPPLQRWMDNHPEMFLGLVLIFRMK